MTTIPPLDPATLPPIAPPRHGRKIALRMVPVLLFVVACLGGWRAWTRAQPHLQASAYLSSLGGDIDWYWDRRGWNDLGHTVAAFDDRWIGGLRDEDLPHLGRLHRLERLGLIGDNGVTNEGLKTIAGLGDLQELVIREHAFIPDDKFDDKGLGHLKRLTRLRVLELAGTGLTDAGLSQLAGLARLEDLDLSQTRITDAGLKHVAGMRRLRVLRLSKTAVTPEGVAALQRERPDLDIIVDEPEPNRVR